jgi:hypothetical protein
LAQMITGCPSMSNTRSRLIAGMGARGASRQSDQVGSPVILSGVVPLNHSSGIELLFRYVEAIARTYPPTQTTLRLLQRITPDGLTLGLIQCQDCGTPLIAISIDADQSRWRQVA